MIFRFKLIHIDEVVHNIVCGVRTIERKYMYAVMMLHSKNGVFVKS